MLNDAERPTVDKRERRDGETVDQITDLLTIQQYGEGLRAAFGNAEYLLDAGDDGVDTYLAELPGGDDDLRQLDPDDLLKENWASVETLLASARPATDHRGYQRWQLQRERQARQTHDTTTGIESHDGDQSALFDLDAPDVIPVAVGERVDNPLGHHGDSGGYFVYFTSDRGDLVGYDHKYNVTYNALTYILCEAGERRASEPNGPVDRRELWSAWKHAKQKGHIPDDDPVPYKAMVGVAVADGVVDRDELIERNTNTGEVVRDDTSASTYQALPPKTYNSVLGHIDIEYDLDPGREPVEGSTDPADRLESTGDEREDELREFLAEVIRGD